MADEPRISVSLSRRINLGDYESTEVFVSVRDVSPTTSQSRIQEVSQVTQEIMASLVSQLDARVAERKHSHREQKQAEQTKD